ncbi:MAG: hypothetical protein CMM02_08255 [Rhodopirellula sp.]|nr:hypothetical protein [Rhodopirellula sp.]MAT10986.1 hypothetical protein [Rhodopirellula sp.]|tara:strand:+ start:80 stop:496 length:417 start_codon:yes stop_codon:yes gene_type:complete
MPTYWVESSAPATPGKYVHSLPNDDFVITSDVNICDLLTCDHLNLDLPGRLGTYVLPNDARLTVACAPHTFFASERSLLREGARDKQQVIAFTADLPASLSSDESSDGDEEDDEQSGSDDDCDEEAEEEEDCDDEPPK